MLWHGLACIGIRECWHSKELINILPFYYGYKISKHFSYKITGMPCHGLASIGIRECWHSKELMNILPFYYGYKITKYFSNKIPGMPWHGLACIGIREWWHTRRLIIILLLFTMDTKYQNIFHIKSQKCRGTDWHALALGNAGTARC